MSPIDVTLFVKANYAVPAIVGPMSNRSSLTPIYPASLTDYLKSHYVGLRDGTGIVIGWVGKSCTIELWSGGKLPTTPGAGVK